MHTLLAASIVLLLSLSSAAHANCEEFWVTRNLIMDRAGHCFGTVLGQSVMNNADCTGSNPAVHPADAQAMRDMRAREAEIGCSIDTSRGPSPTLSAIHARLSQLETLPVRVGQLDGAGCLGYLGPPVALYRGARAQSGQIATLTPNINVFFMHVAVAGWVYVTATPGSEDRVIAHGWLAPGSVPAGSCTQTIP
ncbi:MAG: DUF4453 domain-containing protein [Pseudomonadota bacterium]